MNEDGEGMYFTDLSSSSGTDATFGTVKGKGKKDESIDWSEAK